MTEQERIETLLTALDAALDMIDYYMYRPAESIYYKDSDFELLRQYAKHEREKQGTMNEKESVGDNEQEKEA